MQHLHCVSAASLSFQALCSVGSAYPKNTRPILNRIGGGRSPISSSIIVIATLQPDIRLEHRTSAAETSWISWREKVGNAIDKSCTIRCPKLSVAIGKTNERILVISNAV